MAKNMMPVYILSAIACFCLRNTAASVCKPHSVFKVDCNTCRCSSSGMEFSCTDIICEPLIYKDKYLIEQNEKGYTILKPKTVGDVSNDKKLNHNNDLFINDGISNKPNLQREQRYLIKPPMFAKILIPRKSSNIAEDSPDYEDLGKSSPDYYSENQVDDGNSLEDVEPDYVDNNVHNSIDNTENDYLYPLFD